MPRRLDIAAPDFAQEFETLVHAKREAEADVDEEVAAILDEVRARGDRALIDYTERFDRLRLGPEELRVPEAEIEAAAARAPGPAVAALKTAAARIEAFHERQMPTDQRFTDAAGVELGWRWTPLGSVGLYVPGGSAAYPSTVLMTALPARVAGVGRVAMAVPAPDGGLNPLVLAAARIAGVHEIYRVGGAQAIAALAFGTESIAPVDKIFGPGNVYVAAAKRQVFGAVGIDLIAGPSEILIVADAANDAEWIAADLLAQAEHDPRSQAIAITDDRGFAARIEDALARQSWERNGAVIVVESIDQAPALVDRIAPEHLELAVAEPRALAQKVRNAGAIFLGRFAPEALGDYVAGPNHVLPTSGAARFASGLSVLDFLKRTTLMGCDAAGLGEIGPAAVALAQAEGLSGHARSVAIRLAAPDDG